MKTLLFLSLAVLIHQSASAQHHNFFLSQKGLVIEAGGAGNFTLEPPKLSLKNGENEKPYFERVDSKNAVATYPSGAKLEYTIKGTVANLHYSNAPANAQSFRFTMPISMKFNQGGQYAYDGTQLKPFPIKNDEQFLQHGTAKTITIQDPAGQGFTLYTPGGYSGLQDNRPKGWGQSFGYIYQYDTFGKAEGWFSFEVKPSSAEGISVNEPTKPKVIVDRYGQSMHTDYPEKIQSDEQLKSNVAKQAEQMAAYQPDQRFDRYGGLVGTGENYGLTKTGFFHVGKAGNRDVLVTPNGNLFFHLAFCSLQNIDDYTTVRGRENIYEWLPPKEGIWKTAWRNNNPGSGVVSFYIANWIRKFERPYSLEEWSDQTVKRLRSWGFNSAGAFSANTETMQSINLPNVGFLPLGKRYGLPMLPDRLGAGYMIDPFADNIEAKLDKVFAEHIAPHADDPLLIGYFMGNEQHVEDIPKVVPTYKASEVPAKAALVQMLKEEYGDIDRFNVAWNPAMPLSSFEEAGEKPLFVRTEKSAEDMRQYFRLYLQKFYSLVEDSFRKYDANHLLIGRRWTPATANVMDVVEIAGPHLDVLSINYYTYAIDDAFLSKVNRWSGGKPIILSEWHYCVNDRGLQARMEMANQRDRAHAYRNYVEQAASLPFVVGIEWFSYFDQSLTGRFFEGFNGEGNAVGFVDVTDQPYEEMVSAAQKTNFQIYAIMMGEQKPYQFEDPRFDTETSGSLSKIVQIPKALPGLKLDGTTKNWPGRPAEPISPNRTVVGLADESFSADYRLCWDEENLYLHATIKDPTPMQSQRSGDKLWSADGVELLIGPKDLDATGKPLYSDRHILIGASEERKLHVIDYDPEASGESIETLVIKNVSGDGYLLQAAIPWSVIGLDPAPGKEFLFDLMVDNSNDGLKRVAQLAWNGARANSNERENWGRAILSAN